MMACHYTGINNRRQTRQATKGAGEKGGNDNMKEKKATPYKINTFKVNNYVVHIWARPWRFQGSREIYAATITTKCGYLKGKTRWSGALASTVQRAMEIAYE